mmetsp:Transcript_17229/g.32611  ORF Transcript_17229/g.32611 Transcript_17229/m.32611 type:complete len:582 (+) Transcript_17229:124-1869(+)
MDSRGGRGRDAPSNEPAWMERDHHDHYARDRYRDRDYRDDHPPRDNRDRKRDDRDRYRDDRRGGGGGGGSHRSRRGPSSRPRKGIIVFHSYEEEMAWVEERRRRRKARKSLFDVEPTEEQLAMEELQKAALASHGPNPNVFLRPEERVAPVMALETSVSLQSPQTRHARRLYIGQISPDLSDRDIHDFFRDAVNTAMGITDPDPDEDPVLSVYTNRDRHFAFVEFTSIEITTACLALNGMNMLNRGRIVVKRPNDYNPAIAPVANPEFMTKFDVSKLGIVSNIVPDSPHKIFIGGVPYHLNDDQVMELLSAFGKIRAFHLVKSDSNAVTSKGYCFVEYVDESVRDIAIMGLNGMDMGGGKVLTAKVASERAEGEGVEVGTAAAAVAATLAGPTTNPVMSSLADAMSMSLSTLPSTAPPIMRIVDGVDVEALVDFAMGNGNNGTRTSEATTNNSLPSRSTFDTSMENFNQNMHSDNGSSSQSRILVLHNMVTDDDFATVEDYESLKEEVKEECQKFGTLVSMKIPHPKDGFSESAVKKIFLEYATLNGAALAKQELTGRQFGNSNVEVTYFDESDYFNRKLH